MVWILTYGVRMDYLYEYEGRLGVGGEGGGCMRQKSFSEFCFRQTVKIMSDVRYFFNFTFKEPTR